MSYLGDHRVGATVDCKFRTATSTGAPIALVGGVISAYKDNDTTQSTAGVTLTSPFDSLTGFHHVRITTASDGTFYSAGSDFQVVITTGTVNAVSAVGTVVAEFSIENRSALLPTTAGRKLDVSAGGEAGVDWANVGSPTTTLNLSGTTVKTATDVETDTADIQTRIPAALVSGRIDASVGAMAAAVLTATAIASDAITDAKVASDVTIASVTGAVGSVTGAVGSVGAGGIAASTFAAGAIDAAALSVDAGAELADAFLNRNMATGTDSGSSSVRTVRQALRALRNKWSVSGGTYTVTTEDDATTSWTAAVTGTAGADPITTSDPAGP